MQTQIVVSPYGFTGREFSSGEGNAPGPGLYYYRARYYDPTVGRFLSEDPEGYAGGGNAYAYAGNLPTLLTDPLGLFPTWYHRYITYKAALKAFGSKCQDKAKAVADANASVDALPTWKDKLSFALGGEGWGLGGPHFPIGGYDQALLDNAVKTCNLHSLGTALHTMQDGYAHLSSQLGRASVVVHYFLGPIPDYAGILLPNSAEAEGETRFWLTDFKEKCLKCCQ